MPARRMQLDALQARVEASARDGAPLGVMVVRILQLREFRILFGYELAESLIDAAAELMRSVLRPTDVVDVCEGEFIVSLPGLLSANHALLAASRVVRAFRQPLMVDGHGMLATVAAGIAICPEHDVTADGLCRRADTAYGEALRTGEQAMLFEPRDQFLDVPYGALRAALENGHLQVHLQPIVDPHAGRVVGVESLARWHSPGLGTISPDVFVPLAEQSGLIGDMTRWSLNTTMRLASQAKVEQRGLHVALNLSPRVFLDHSFGDQLLATLRLWDMAPSSVVLEVTEGAVMEDPQQSAAVLERMRDAGMSVALDDFGVGQSSFAYLKQFPANEVKIDQSFIRDVAVDARSAQLVASMIELAHRLGMRVVAEGVEDQATLDALVGMGCDLVQGFHVGRPQPADLFFAGLDARNALAALARA